MSIAFDCIWLLLLNVSRGEDKKRNFNKQEILL